MRLRKDELIINNEKEMSFRIRRTQLKLLTIGKLIFVSPLDVLAHLDVLESVSSYLADSALIPCCTCTVILLTALASVRRISLSR